MGDHAAMSGRTGPRVTVLASGSAGNAVLLEAGQHRILVDAGLSVDAMERAMERVGVAITQIGAIALTHEHEDHARGAGAVARAASIPVFANRPTAAGADLAGVDVIPFEAGRPFEAGPFTVTAFAVPHDAAAPVGFAVEAAGRRIVIATDLGAAGQQMDRYLAGADLIVLESNYDLGLLQVSAYPWFLKNRILSGRGHLSNDDAGRALARTAGRARTVCLAHLSEVNNLASLARDTVIAALRRAGNAADRVRAVSPNGCTEPMTIA